MCTFAPKFAKSYHKRVMPVRENKLLKKNYKMRKKFTLALLSLLMVPLAIMAQTGSKGTTITFDKNNSTMLYTELQGGLQNAPYSCFLRHNQAPIQLLNANPFNSTSGYTIAPLQTEYGTGTGFYANSSLANNMGFSSDGRVQFYNLNSSSGWAGAPYKYICFAVIAPKGYRFTEYWMSIDGSQHNGANGATIMRYTYNEGSTYLFTPCAGESLALTSATEQIFSHTLSNAENLLYFRVEVNNASTQACVTMNQLRLTYVIDSDVEATIPNSDGLQVHTGIVNLGEFGRRANDSGRYSDYFFWKANITDLENVNIVADNETSAISIKNGAIEVPAGTYWIESPAKFRFTGAKLNFKQATAQSEPTYTNLGQDLQAALGQTVKIGNGSNFIVSNGTTSFSNGTQATGTTWIITKVEGTDNKYYIQNESGDYLKLTNNNALTVAAGAFEWTYYEKYDNGVDTNDYYTNRHQTSDHCFVYVNSSNYHYGLQFYSNSWRAIRTNANRDNSARIPTPISFVKVEATTYGAEDFVATVYGANGTDVAGTASISTSNPTGSVEATGLNNDGVKFTVTGSAAFTVDLTMQPLDPNVQTLEVGYLPNNAEVKPNNSVDNVSVTSSNFKFNNGEVIAIPIRPEDDQVSGATHQIVFRNAYNESRIDWYDGTATGLSNYHLVGSYDESGTIVTSTGAPYAKVDANQAGITKIEFSNIKSLTKSGGTLTETVFQKSNAGYEDISLADGVEKDVYIYTADEPLNCIMTAAHKNKNNHIAYTFYEAKVKPIKVNETPVVTVKELYAETFKGDNTKVGIYNQAFGKELTIGKDTKLDTTHKFYGVTVTSKSDVQGVETLGYLTGEAIVEAIKAEMKKQTGIYSTEDPFRTLLYVDMSALKSISGDENTWKEIMLGSADNCLFFMPSNFAISQSMPGGGIIAGGDNGVAVTDITIIDQQPFYTPHNFRTSTHLANYSRKVTPVEGHENTTTVTLVLPFQVNLSTDGHLKTASDAVNTDVQFFNLTDNITKNQYNENIYDVTLANATDAAPAGTPYVVKSNAEVTGGTVFGISVLAARFASTEGAKLEGKDASFISHGTFSGTVIRDNIFYFSKDYLWNSKTLTDKYVNIRPFRAWYTTDNSTINALARLGMTTDGEATGINDITVDEPTNGVVYDIQGRVVSTTGTSGLSKGLYIMNGKKIFVK